MGCLCDVGAVLVWCGEEVVVVGGMSDVGLVVVGVLCWAGV